MRAARDCAKMLAREVQLVWGLELALGAMGVALAIPAGVLALECFAALLPESGVDGSNGLPASDDTRTAILVPAHDEEVAIGDTVRALRRQLGAGDRLVVIADNCSDRTAAVARDAGAEVLERTDREHRGKGFALQFGLEHLDADPPDLVAVIDADCSVSERGVAILASKALHANRPVQGTYLLVAPRSAPPLTMANAFAFLLRGRVRPLGLLRLRLPCHLSGSGMAFPWRVLREAPATGANLVEDLVMGLDMALRGHPPLVCPDAWIRSELPTGQTAAQRQRRRWEHGQLSTLARYGPRLLVEGIRGGRLDLLALGLDLCVPPVSLLIFLQMLHAGLAATLWLAGGSAIPLAVASCSLFCVLVAVSMAWLRFGWETLPPRFLMTLPLYLLWKVPIYLSLLSGGKQRTWERTRRPRE